MLSNYYCVSNDDDDNNNNINVYLWSAGTFQAYSLFKREKRLYLLSAEISDQLITDERDTREKRKKGERERLGLGVCYY